MSKNRHEEPEKRKADVVKRYLEGETQAQIAQSLGLTQPQISNYIQEARKEWRAEYSRDSAEVFDQQLAALMHTKREFWLAWNESKTIIESTSHKKGFRGDIEIDETTVTREKSLGNPAYLNGVVKCILKELDLRGIAGELKEKDIKAAIKRLKTEGYSVSEPGTSDAAIALNYLVAAKLVPESIITSIFAALKKSEDVMTAELQKVFDEAT
ncbi:MAG: helix-turn-helix domain-containing protein [Rhizonema sp. NSF051]|nr:helix-turn-helix domain-containing protein [Rhizonema sp. NSF051]